MAAVQEPLMSGAIGGSPGRFDIRNQPNLRDLNDFPNNNNNGGGGGGGGGNDVDDIDLEDDEDDPEDAWAAEVLRLSKQVYNPLRPGPDNPTDADGVALGVVPDHDARRWRERRMRLARYIQFVVEGPAIDDDDVPAPLAKMLDLDFEREEVLVAAPVVKGGRGKGGMGSFLAERPAPGGADLRKRREWVGGGDDGDRPAPQAPPTPVQPNPSPPRQRSPAQPPPQQQPQQQQPLSEKARGKLPAVNNRGSQGRNNNNDPFVGATRLTRPSGAGCVPRLRGRRSVNRPGDSFGYGE
ncbi:hypothetical protein VMCG_05806 [Cytospora schulzeri]|uniref:Uncharacterized protein n=1 Tax=Cytospora schulzeri TaxID=448051 RepID=A0A423WI59_9PEZI|nr:hypothetical protein VMCG_05806 [Valsa malicola]